MALLSVNSLQAKPEVIDWKVLSSDKFNASDITSVDVFIDKDQKVFVEIYGPGVLWMNDNWVSTRKYGGCLNGFVKDGLVYLAFRADEKNINIYSVGKDITLEKSITSPNSRGFYCIYQIVAVSGENDVSSSYILSLVDERSLNPIEYMKSWSGHGIIYDKPVLTEIQGQKLLDDQKIPYGGKINESYRIREVLTGKNTIHFLGFRTQKQLGAGEPSTPEVLHYAEYNVKKKKLVRAQDIYEKTPYFDENDKLRHFYWHVSADNFNDDLFIVFSWNGIRGSSKSVEIKMENIDTPIYYSQSDGKAFGKVEVIGRGILPLVKADSVGNAHVVWANSNGDIVHKAKKDGKWGDEQIVLDGVIDVDEVWEGMYQGTSRFKKISAQFDRDNNLNVVFPSNGKLVYAKIRMN